MLTALASGTLIRDPKSGTSTSGTRWCNTTIRCAIGQDKDGATESAFVNIVCFGDQADKLARLAKGDNIAVQGSLKPSSYEKDGETRHGLEMVVQGILSPYDLRKRRGNDATRPDHRDQPDRRHGQDFNDNIAF